MSKNKTLIAISVHVITGGKRDGTAFRIGNMRSCAPSIGTVRTRNSTASGFRLRANGEDHFVQRTAQAMQLIDEIENYRNALVVYADVCEIPDQSCARNVDIEELSRLAVRPQPSGLNPGRHHCGVDPGSREKFARFHAHAFVVS